MRNMTYQPAILKNDTDDHHLDWVAACEASKEDITYRVIDLTRGDWLQEVQKQNDDIYLTRAPDRISYIKQLYDERLYIMHRVLDKPIYPSYEEILVYENKKFLSYWLKANKVPHPETWVFYYKQEALEFARTCTLPIVGKTSIGASGSGVKIIKDRDELRKYIQQVFSEKGITRRWGPNLKRGDFKKRLFNRLKNIPDLMRYFKKKFNAAQMDPHRWFAIFQAYVPAEFEWRAVRIGDSFFAHKKLATMGSMFSGTSKVGWGAPPEKLLDFVKSVTDKRNFLAQAVDIFEDEGGNYLVNELQCCFGSKNPHQMIVGDKPGRFVHKNNSWVFEEGHFNQHNSYDLRLRHALELLKNK